MAIEVKIPHLGYTMTEAKILGWLKNVGDFIETGEEILEIETEKVTYRIESPASGFLKVILAYEGDLVPVGTPVAIIGEADEEIDLTIYVSKTSQTVSKNIQESPQPAIPRNSKAVFETLPSKFLVSPAAKKLAKNKGVDLNLIKGSGLSGRIRLADVEKFIAKAKDMISETPQSGISEIAQVIPMSSMRRSITKRLTKSLQVALHFNLFIEVDMTEAKVLISHLKEKSSKHSGLAISLNDLFIKAVAVTLRDYPLMNIRLNGDQIEVLANTNIGLAVALEDGLIVPAIENADKKRISQIASEREDLIRRARSGQLSIIELERGTFTISNLGRYGIKIFTSIINPPQSAILSIGKIMDRTVVREGSIVIRPIVEMSLAIDHRVIDGAYGAAFLCDLKGGLEYPSELIF